MSLIQCEQRNLPFEILIIILESATNEDLINHALVCKAWLKPVQSILYGEITIKTLSQLENFHDSVINNPFLGDQVKVLSLKVYPNDYAEEVNLNEFKKKMEKIMERVSSLLYDGLPNLQELYQNCLRTYVPVLNALKNSRLKKLMILNSPSGYTKDEQANHAACIVLMGDKVDKLDIRNEDRQSTDLTSNHLYNILDQLPKLKELEIADYSSVPWIQTLEHITSSCKGLKNFTFTFEKLKNIGTVIDTLVPYKNMESIEGEFNNCKLYTYIIQKFPQPRELKLSHWYDFLGLEEYARLLSYLPGIDTIEVGRVCVNRRVLDVTANWWEETSAELGSKVVEACYSEFRDKDCSLDIVKPKSAKEPTFSFIYHIINLDSQHTEVIEKLGKFIGEFHLNYVTYNGEYNLPRKEDLPKQFLDNLFKHCPHLHSLQLEGWVLRKKCIIIGNYLSHLSTLLPHLKRLLLQGNSYHSKDIQTSTGYYKEYRIYKDLVYNMPQTEIDCVVISTKYYEDEPLVKLFVESDKTYYYYRYEEEEICSSNEEEFNQSKERNRIHLRCLNKPKFQFVF
ncbi:unnamed protein product [Mucor hiemalis]